MNAKKQPNLDSISGELKKLGIDLEDLSGTCCDSDLRVRAICVVPDIGESVRELAESPRDHVVMVRVDADSARGLDRWVASGAVKSRSEAAALFISEGLKLHSRELQQLDDALAEVERARQKLRQKVREVLDPEENPDDDNG